MCSIKLHAPPPSLLWSASVVSKGSVSYRTVSVIANTMAQ